MPLLPRLRNVLLANNRLQKFDRNLSPFLPNLQCLILNNNQLASWSDMEGVFEFKRLRVLSLVENPICKERHYREYIVYRLPLLKYLDFRKVKESEREKAKKVFSGDKGNALLKSMQGQASAAGVDKHGRDEEDVLEEKRKKQKKDALTPEEIEKIKDAILKATSLDEVSRLERLLRSGRLP